MSKAKTNPFNEITGPSPETLVSVLDLLEIKKPELRKAHGGFLHGTVCSFEMARAFEKAYATDHQVMDQLRELTDLLNKTETSMLAIRPDFQAMIQLQHPEYSRDDWKGLIAGLKKLGGVLEISKTAKLKRRKVDAVFERYVAFLMLRIRDATGKLAHARASDDRYNRPTRLASKEAEAIWMLLKHIEGVTENNVANRIIKLERLHRDQLEQAYPEYDLTGVNLTPLTAKD